MLSTFVNFAKSGLNMLQAAIPMGIKSLKYFIDSTFRDKVTPVAGSVLYCDLWLAVEHSGIYVGDGDISNIVVDGLAESEVKLSSPRSFTSKSTLGRKIYVSCDKYGAVGDDAVRHGADSHVGERAFYGLVIKNCHHFSTKCVNYAGQNDESFFSRLFSFSNVGETWEPSMLALKNAARERLGATKWRLWDWDNETEQPTPEPDWQAHQDFFAHQALNKNSIEQIRAELAATQDYEAEIADEAIPQSIRQQLASFRQNLADISQKYEQVKEFLALNPDARFSYADLKACNEDFSALAKILQNNQTIKELAKKMGRDYISEQKKKQIKIPEASKSEVYGTHRSDDVMRLLPSELLNLEDETLETLFYARLLEKNLLTYELQGVTFKNGEETEETKKRTGPVVTCLDTSGSMAGAPMLKAKALLLAIANILKQEERSLHVLLFGASGEIREFSMDRENNAAGLLAFLQQGFGGGTDFESPLKRAFEIIALQKDYKKADVLMISDGDCQLSPEFTQIVTAQKHRLDCMVYSVLCNGARVEDSFSDEVVVV
ncbi:MAG: VWA domain-containing protein [Methylococcales bacterium]|nr:VWA domain-containing protein [Methylococcales bacterium]